MVLLDNSLQDNKFGACRSDLGENAKQEEVLLRSTDSLDAQADLDEFSTSIRSKEDICKELSERQEQAFQAVSQDLLCSPDIVRYALSHL